MRLFALIGMLALSACGADGPPEIPGVFFNGGDVLIGVHREG